MEEKAFLQFKLNKLYKEIRVLEEALAGVDWNKRAKDYLALVKPQRRPVKHGEDKQKEDLSLQSELSSKASYFSIKEFSRALRLTPNEFDVYDCWLLGETSHVKFELKFVETVLALSDEYGNMSEASAQITMIKDDPESLSDWLARYVGGGDIPGIINGIVEFSVLARKRRVILHSLIKKQLGSRSIEIESIEGKGVLVNGIGTEGNIVLSILWKISFCEATESMMPSFEVEFNAQGFNDQAVEVFESLRKPFIRENLLPEIWEAVAEALISYSE